MMGGKQLMAALLMTALMVPEVAIADDGGAPWDEEMPSPTDALLLQASAHRVTGQTEGGTDANEHAIVAQVLETYIVLGVDPATAEQIAALQADSVEKAKTLTSTRRRRNFFRTLFRKVPVFNLIPKITDPLYRAIGPAGRSLVRNLEPDIRDVALGALFGGVSVRRTLRALLRSRLKQIKQQVIEDAAGRLLVRQQAEPQSDGTAALATAEGLIRWDLATEDFAAPVDPTFTLGLFHWDAMHPDSETSADPHCQYLQLHITAISMALVFDVASQTIVGGFEGLGSENYRESDGRGNDATGEFVGELVTTLTGTTSAGDPKFEGTGDVTVNIATTMHCDYWSDGEHLIATWDEAGTYTGPARIQILMMPEEDDQHLSLSVSINSAAPPDNSGWNEEPAIMFSGTATGLDLPVEYREATP